MACEAPPSPCLMAVADCRTQVSMGVLSIGHPPPVYSCKYSHSSHGIADHSRQHVREDIAVHSWRAKTTCTSSIQCLIAAIRPLHVEELTEIFAIEFDAKESPNLVEGWRPENPEEAVADRVFEFNRDHRRQSQRLQNCSVLTLFGEGILDF